MCELLQFQLKPVKCTAYNHFKIIEITMLQNKLFLADQIQEGVYNLFQIIIHTNK